MKKKPATIRSLRAELRVERKKSADLRKAWAILHDDNDKAAAVFRAEIAGLKKERPGMVPVQLFDQANQDAFDHNCKRMKAVEDFNAINSDLVKCRAELKFTKGSLEELTAKFDQAADTQHNGCVSRSEHQKTLTALYEATKLEAENLNLKVRIEGLVNQAIDHGPCVPRQDFFDMVAKYQRDGVDALRVKENLKTALDTIVNRENQVRLLREDLDKHQGCVSMVSYDEIVNRLAKREQHICELSAKHDRAVAERDELKANPPMVAWTVERDRGPRKYWVQFYKDERFTRGEGRNMTAYSAEDLLVQFKISYPDCIVTLIQPCGP